MAISETNGQDGELSLLSEGRLATATKKGKGIERLIQIITLAPTTGETTIASQD